MWLIKPFGGAYCPKNISCLSTKKILVLEPNKKITAPLLYIVFVRKIIINETGKKLTKITGEPRETLRLRQRLSLAVQRSNTVSVICEERSKQYLETQLNLQVKESIIGSVTHFYRVKVPSPALYFDERVFFLGVAHPHALFWMLRAVQQNVVESRALISMGSWSSIKFPQKKIHKNTKKKLRVRFICTCADVSSIWVRCYFDEGRIPRRSNHFGV